jgi:hypothetical protein
MPTPPKELEQWGLPLLQSLQEHLSVLAQAINGNLTFGDGVDYDNIAGEFHLIPSSGPVGSDVVVPHGIGKIPVGFLVTVPPFSGAVTRGSTPWTETEIHLNASANQSFTIFILAPPLR